MEVPKVERGFTALHQELTEKRGFAKKPCLLGRSRGGVWVTSWAVENPIWSPASPEYIPCSIFAVIQAWPKAAPSFGLTPEELTSQLSQHNPIERVPVLAKARIPAFLIHGDSDKVVPLEQNSAAFAAHYKDAGAAEAVTLVVPKGQGHNYWEGFFRCQELIDFAIARARGK